MSGRSMRSFPILSLVAVFLLVIALTLACADEKKSDDSANTQEQAAPATNTQTSEQLAPERARGREMRVPEVENRQGPAVPARPETTRGPSQERAQPQGGPSPNQSPPRGWQRTPGPAYPPANGPAPVPGRGDRANPYQPYRGQPEERNAAPNNSAPGYRAQPYRPPLRDQGEPAQSSRTTQPDRWERPAPGRWSTPENQSRPAGERLRPEVPEGVRERETSRDRNATAVPQPEGRRLTVPRASFRGPEADERVRTIPAERQPQVQSQLRNQVRQLNVTRGAPKSGRLLRDVIGNLVPKDARFIQRNNVGRIKSGATRLEAVLGYPTYYYSFIPRYPSDYWEGYWDGYRNGYWDGRRHVPHGAVVINFYYGYYWSDPFWFGFYYPGYYASVYHYVGFCPGWIYPTRVYYSPVEYVYVPLTPYRYYAPSRLVDERGAESAISDIRRAWFDNDIDRIASHLTDELDIQVYFDGEYSYTTSTEDYYAMTADALATTSTMELEFDNPIFISSHEVFYTGRHVFYDPDGYRQTVYVSYRLRHLGTRWYLVAIGTSLNPIQHQYHDFRYN